MAERGIEYSFLRVECLDLWTGDMSGTVLTAGEWLALITHAKKWLANLRRAGRRRRLESRDALREGISVLEEAMDDVLLKQTTK